jgi:hypothetical protein
MSAKHQEDFVRAVMSAAATRLQYKARILVTAWGAMESGWGQTRQAKLGYNYWNVSKGSWTGPTMAGNDTEYSPGSLTPRPITQQWRVYASLDAALTDLLRLLSTSKYVNYRTAHSMLCAGDAQFVSELGLFEVVDGKLVRVDDRPNVGSYYTLPRSKYQAHFDKTLKDVTSLAARLKLDVAC